ncbi:MAG: D-cysteine desulfhydrase family protein [Desulfopila sp.]|jgi:D-cysteine desulfhydrase|nr:D-cysteine desulfhydrase family protein [Desulfopila sp.]
MEQSGNDILPKRARAALGYFPTPLIRLQHLEKFLGGPRLFMKRDDQTGLGMGGNKTRKLEFLLGDAIQQGSDCIITAGAAQSNHCRQTAAAAAACGLECHLALGGVAPPVPRGNLLLDILFGAQIHWSGSSRKGENIPDIVAQLKKEGRHPYVIPYGGSNSIGAAGFVTAIFELEEQIRALHETVDHIVFASSSGGTHAGMLVGKALTQANYRITGINIDKEEVFGMKLESYIPKLAGQTAQNFGIEPSAISFDVDLKPEYHGRGYGVVGELEREAIFLTARHEGILLDPVYTGRAMGGLIDMIRSGCYSSQDAVLFWHTGGNPALFASDDLLPTE